MSSVSCENTVVATVVLNRPDNASCSHELRDGQRLFVGSDESADVRVIDDRVASIHCTLSAENGVVCVRDCYSEAGTFVNDSRIREISLRENFGVRVGSYEFEVLLTTSRPENRAATVPVAECSPDAEAGFKTVSPELPSEVPADATSNDSASQQSDDLQFALIQARAEIEILTQRLEATTAVTPSAGDPWQEEMIELLRAEVMELQTALADQEQASRGSLESFPADDTNEFVSKDEAERLVQRLEQLLGELNERDEQVSTLTELLQAAEDANRAEKEERTQLDAWLCDIEQRFGHREQEWHAERDKLQQALDDMTAERDRAEQAMNANTSNAKLEAAGHVVNGLRETAERQRSQLLKSEETIAKLRQQLEQATHSQSREELVRLAEERAEIARQRQEFDALRNRKEAVGPNEADLKLRALRQHLNEIHEEEKTKQEERKLSSRLSRLWSRLDGR